MNVLLRFLLNRHVRKQMGMTRREHRDFINECHNSTPWEGGTGANNATIFVPLQYP